MAYWILQHNPATLSSNCRRPHQIPPNLDYWRIRRYWKCVCICDIAFIWHAGSPKVRGIYNVATIVSVPTHSPEAENDINLMWESDRPCYDPDVFTRLRRYKAILIRYHYSDDLHPPLLLQELSREHFGDLPVSHMPQSGIYRLDQTSGDRLLQYIKQTR